MNIYEVITNQIIEAIESKKVLPWKRPWKQYSDGAAIPRNLCSKKAYRGINAFLLALQPVSSSYWVTFKQARALKGSVRKGEKGTPILYWSIAEKEEKEEKETGKKERYCFARFYTVFNIEQCTGIKAPKEEEITLCDTVKIERCESIIEGYTDKPEIKEGRDQAFYSPAQDLINMPLKGSFEKSEHFYATLFHELGHSTGHKSRLNRNEISERAFFGSSDYSKEELVAEMAASFLAAESGISPVTFEESVSYLDGWLKILKANSRLIVDAAASAQKAVDWILKKNAADMSQEDE